MRIKEIITEGVAQPIEVYSQSNDVGGGKIIFTHSVESIDGYEFIDEMEIYYVDSIGKTRIKYRFKDGIGTVYDEDNHSGHVLPDSPSIDELEKLFTDAVNNIMRDNYERLSINQNEKEDWTMNQIKKKQYESKNLELRETKNMPGGMKAAMARFRELYGSYEQHLAMKNSKTK